MFDNFLCGSLFALVAAVALVTIAPETHNTHQAATNLSTKTEVVLMPEVQVIGKRSPEFASSPEIVRLPMVTVTGHRDTAPESVAVATTTN